MTEPTNKKSPFRFEVQRSARGLRWEVVVAVDDPRGIRRHLLSDEEIEASVTPLDLTIAVQRAGIPPELVDQVVLSILERPRTPAHVVRRQDHLAKARSARKLDRFCQILAVIAWAVQFDPETRAARDPLRAVWR